MKIRPVYDRILVKVAESQKKSKGGILIPDTGQEKPQKGEVLAVGPGRINEHDGSRLPMCVKVGDVVVFVKWAGHDIKDLGDGYLLMNETDVMGVVEP